MRSISVIHPSTKRHVVAITAATKVLSQSTTGLVKEYIMAIEEEDSRMYNHVIKNINRRTNGSKATPSLLPGRYGNCVAASNAAAAATSGDIIVLMSDDFELCDGWDEKILAATEGKERWLLKTYDGIQSWIATFPIMDRALYDELGYVYNPKYEHMFADTDLAATCDLLGVTITREDIRFTHLHYSKPGSRAIDSVNRKNDLTFYTGEEIFLKRAKEGFVQKPVGKIENKPILDWLKMKLK